MFYLDAINVYLPPLFIKAGRTCWETLDGFVLSYKHLKKLVF